MLTSALLPSATKCEMPTPARRACSSSATPSGPDWLENATRPGRTVTGANVACIDTSGTVLMTPMLAGPSKRMP